MSQGPGDGHWSSGPWPVTTSSVRTPGRTLTVARSHVVSWVSTRSETPRSRHCRNRQLGIERGFFSVSLPRQGGAGDRPSFVEPDFDGDAHAVLGYEVVGEPGNRGGAGAIGGRVGHLVTSRTAGEHDARGRCQQCPPHRADVPDQGPDHRRLIGNVAIGPVVEAGGIIHLIAR